MNIHGKDDEEFVEFSDYDALDFQTLGDTISSWLKQYKKVFQESEMRGVPADIAEHCDETNEDRDEYWLSLIDQMIYAFDDVEPDYKGHIDLWAEPSSEEGYKRIRTQVSDEPLWKQYMKDVEDHQKRVEHGLKLFAEYFRGMWI